MPSYGNRGGTGGQSIKNNTKQKKKPQNSMLAQIDATGIFLPISVQHWQEGGLEIISSRDRCESDEPRIASNSC